MSTSWHKMQEWKKELNHKLTDAVNIMVKNQYSNPYIKQYLWYKLPEVWTSEVCEFIVAEEMPNGAYLACPMPFDGFKNTTQNWHIFFEALKTKPILNPN